MNHNDDGWSLFRLSDRKQMDGVSLSKVEFLFESLPESLHADWLMWRDGFSGWRPLSELSQILTHLQKKPDEQPGPPPIPEAVLKMADEITATGRRILSERKTASGVHSGPADDATVRTADVAVYEPVRFEDSAPAAQEYEEPVVEASASEQLPEQESETVAPAEEVTRPFDIEPKQPRMQTVSVRAISAATANLRNRTASGISTSRDKTPAGRESSMNSISGGDISSGGLKTEDSVKFMRQDDRSARQRPKAEEPPSRYGVNVISLPDEATLSLMLDSQAATEDRNNVRYHHRFRVKIFTQGGSVKAETVDASTSGFKMRDPLPPNLPRFFHIEVDLGADGKLPLICSVIKERDGAPAHRIRIQVNDHVNILKAALLRAS